MKYPKINKTFFIIMITRMMKDMGYPPKSNVSHIIINPPSPPKPVFLDPYYVGHLYSNRTFVMNKQPQLQQGTTFYETSFKCSSTENIISRYCQVSLKNGQIVLRYSYPDATYKFLF